MCKYLCHCNSVYVGRTSYRLEKHFKNMFQNQLCRNQVKPQKDLFRRQCKFTQKALILDLAIGQHLLDDKFCAIKFDIN